jgi:hypothetical protein
MLSLSALKWHHKAVADAVFAFRALVPTGIMLVCPSAFSLVVVEGVPKALKRYHKLMLRRIDWTDTPTLPGQQEQEDEEEEEERPRPDKPANSCHLVWEVRLVQGYGGHQHLQGFVARVVGGGGDSCGYFHCWMVLSSFGTWEV